MYNTELTFLSGKESWKDAVISFFPVFYIRIQDGKHFQEIAQFQAELAEARAQLQLLQRDDATASDEFGNPSQVKHKVPTRRQFHSKCVHAREMKASIHTKKTYAQMFTRAPFVISKRWKSPLTKG